ncbi:MAG TPA: hypothetical protein VFP68_21505 [Burkholderiaceae bacterium]|nr:hypothetical protein [Burkholderiaceae bacterium]
MEDGPIARMPVPLFPRSPVSLSIGPACARRLAAGLSVVLTLSSALADPGADSAAISLRARQAALAPQLQDSAFGEPLYLESVETRESASGDVYAVLPHPFNRLGPALRLPTQWCQVLMLHLNVKQCTAAARHITVHLGSKREQSLELAYPLQLDYSMPSDTPEYLQVRMHAGRGPFGTRDTDFELEAVALSTGRCFIHFRYAVRYGMLGRVAMQAYLGITGRDKVGFTRASVIDQGTPAFVTGVRGAVERNAMRYYLAIAVYLDSLTIPENERVERRLQAWFSATERYPIQLHEIDRDDYMAMKRHELTAHSLPSP